MDLRSNCGNRLIGAKIGKNGSTLYSKIKVAIELYPAFKIRLFGGLSIANWLERLQGIFL